MRRGNEGVANAQMTKKGTSSGTVTYAGTHKVIPLDKDRFVMVYDNMGYDLTTVAKGAFPWYVNT